MLRQLRWAVPLGILMAIAGGYAVLTTFEPRFRATYLLELNDDFVLFRSPSNPLEDYVETERVLFFNELILRPVLSDPSLRKATTLSSPETAEPNLRENLSVEAVGSSGRFEVSYIDGDREAAAAVCNAVVESYLRSRASFDHRRIAMLEDLLDPEIRQWEMEVEKKLATFMDLCKATNTDGQISDLGDIEIHIPILDGAQSKPLRDRIDKLKFRLAVEERVRSQEKADEPNEEDSEEASKPSQTFKQRKLKAKIDLLETEHEKMNSQAFLSTSAKIHFVRDDLRRAMDMLSRLSDRAAAIRTERSNLQAVRAISPATPPKHPVEDAPYRKIGLVAGIGFIAPLFFAAGLGLISPPRRHEEASWEQE